MGVRNEKGELHLRLVSVNHALLAKISVLLSETTFSEALDRQKRRLQW